MAIFLMHHLRLDSVYGALTSLADSHEEATAKSVSLVLLGREWHMSLLETTEPVEPPLASISKSGIHYIPALKQRRRLLQRVSCLSLKREDDVKDTQRQAQTPASHNAVERVMAEKRNGSRTGVWPKDRGKELEVDLHTQVRQNVVVGSVQKISCQNSSKVINEHVKHNK